MTKSGLSPAEQAKLIAPFVAGTTARCAADLTGVNAQYVSLLLSTPHRDYFLPTRASVACSV